MCLANLRSEIVGPHYKMSEIEGAHIVFLGFFCLVVDTFVFPTSLKFLDLKN